MECLEVVRGTGHVLEVYKGLEGFDYFAHQWPDFGISTEAASSQLRSFLCTFYREVAFQPRIYQPVETTPLPKMWPSPLHQVVLTIRTVLIHGSPASQHFKKDDTKTIDIAL